MARYIGRAKHPRSWTAHQTFLWDIHFIISTLKEFVSLSSLWFHLTSSCQSQGMSAYSLHSEASLQCVNFLSFIICSSYSLKHFVNMYASIWRGKQWMKTILASCYHGHATPNKLLIHIYQREDQLPRAQCNCYTHILIFFWQSLWLLILHLQEDFTNKLQMPSCLAPNQNYMWRD